MSSCKLITFLFVNLGQLSSPTELQLQQTLKEKNDQESKDDGRHKFEITVWLFDEEKNQVLTLLQFNIGECVTINTKFRSDDQHQKNFIHQEEAVFLNHEKDRLLWFSFDPSTRDLSLNSIDLKENVFESKMKPTIASSEILYDMKDQLITEFGLDLSDQRNSSRRKIGQWPILYKDYFIINGIKPTKILPLKIRRNESRGALEQNKDNLQRKQQTAEFWLRSAQRKCLSDTHIYYVDQQESPLVKIQNISVFLKVKVNGSKISLFTLQQIRGDQIDLVIDQFEIKQGADNVYFLPEVQSGAPWISIQNKNCLQYLKTSQFNLGIEYQSFQQDLDRAKQYLTKNKTPEIQKQVQQKIAALKMNYFTLQNAVKNLIKGKFFCAFETLVLCHDDPSKPTDHRFTLVNRKNGCLIFNYNEGEKSMNQPSFINYEQTCSSSGMLSESRYVTDVKESFQESQASHSTQRENHFSFKVFDLDEKHNDTTDSYKPKKFKFKLPADVKFDHRGVIMTRLVGVGSNISDDKLTMIVTYQSFAGGITKACQTTAFLQLREVNGQQKEIQSDPVMFDDTISFTQFPYLSYSVRFQQNIFVADISRNCSQLKVNISPYKFVTYIQTRGNQPKNRKIGKDGFQKSIEIYFLAFDNDWKLNLLKFKKKEFDQDLTGQVLVVQQNIALEPQYHDNIEQAIIFTRLEKGSCAPVNLILRIKSNEGNQFFKIINFRGFSIQLQHETYLRFVPGLSNEIFFVQKDQKLKKYQIYCMYQRTSNTQIKAFVVHEQDDAILNLQVIQDDELKWRDEDQTLKLGIVDDQFNYKVLTCPANSLEKLQQSADTISLIQQRRIYKSVTKSEMPLHACILNERSILVPTFNNPHQMAIVMNLRTNTNYPIKFLNMYYLENEQQEMKSLREISSIYEAQWGHRRVVRAIEGNFSYFLIKKRAETRHLHLLNIQDQREIVEGQPTRYLIMSNTLLVISYWKCVLFDTKTLMFRTLERGLGFQALCISAQDKQTQISFCWDKQKLLVYKDFRDQDSNDRFSKSDVFTRGKLSTFLQIIYKQNQTLALTNEGDLVHFVFSYYDGVQHKNLTGNNLKITRQESPIGELIKHSFKIEFIGTRHAFNLEYQVLFTENFVALKINSNVGFFKAKIEDILKIQFDTESEDLVKSQRSREYIEKRKIFTYKILFPFPQWNIMERKVIEHSNSANPKVGGRKDVIQIGTPDHLVQFDLNSNQELDHILYYNQLVGTDRFIDPGFVLYQIQDKDKKKFWRGYTEKGQGEYNFNTDKISCNDSNTIYVCPPDKYNKFASCFQPFSEYDIQECLYLERKGVDGNSKIDPDSMLSCIYGETPLQTFLDKQVVFEQITKEINSIKYDKFKDKDQVMHDAPEIRRLYRCIIKGNQNPDRGYDPNQNTLNFALRQGFKLQFDDLISMYQKSSNANKGDVVLDIHDVIKMFKFGGQSTLSFLNESSIQTPMCLEVEEGKWIGKYKQFTFSHNSALLSKDMIMQKFKEQKKRKLWHKLKIKLTGETDERQRSISCQIFDIAWLQSDVKYLYTHLAKHNDQVMYNNLMINSLLQAQNYTKHVMPHLIIYILHIIFMNQHHVRLFKSEQNYVVTALACITLLFQLSHEIVQIVTEQQQYFLDFFNQLQFTTIILNIYCIAVGLLKSQEELIEVYNVDSMLTVPSIAGFLMVFQLIYWATLFQELSFYITLIIEALKDIKEFMLILTCCLAAFTNASIIIEINFLEMQRFEHQKDDEEYGIIENDLSQRRFQNTFFDNLFSQWLLGLGDFELLEKNGQSGQQSVKNLIWIYFLLATLITQIILFNTLIAIIGDTYDRIMDNKIYYAVKAKTEIYADFMYLISGVGGIAKFTENRYMYLLQPCDEEQEVEWEGIIKSIKHKFDKVSIKMSSENKEISKKVQTMIENSSMQLEETRFLDRQQKAQMLRLEKNIENQSMQLEESRKRDTQQQALMLRLEKNIEQLKFAIEAKN